MRKLSFFSAVLSLFLLVPASITRAQTITSQKGLTTAVFPTQFGSVKVYLPDDIMPGEVISGTVVAEPKGNNARQVEKNMAEIKKLQLKLDDLNLSFEKWTIVPDKPVEFSWLVNKDRTVSCPMELYQVGAFKPQELTLKFIQPKAESMNDNRGAFNGCIIPSHALTDAPCKITGSFDGDASNTKCSLNNQPMQVLAESPRQCQVQYPKNATGVQAMQVNENGQEKCTKQISGVDMLVTTGDLNLRKGQKTYIDVRLTGLQNLPDKAILTITNTTTDVVTMTNGNVEVITIWPPPDSANGTFSVHCPAVSIATGNFQVTIDLDLPQPGETTTAANEVPPGYTKKSCDCGASVKISKSGNALKAVATSECKGVYGVGINTFPVCSVLSTTYSWSIKEGKENVELIGKTDGVSVNVRPKNNQGYTVCVTVTVKCIDGTVCTATDSVTQSGETVPPPTGSKCKCSASCEVIAGAKKGNTAEFSAKITAACTGTSGSGETRAQCAVGPITYSWSIGSSGKDVAEIDGKADGSSVKVKLKKDGAYNVYLSGTVKCSDGTTCEFNCNAEIPYTPGTNEKVCLPDVDEKGDPKMVGGLKNKQAGSGSTSTLNRDDFIALEATGSDVDLVTFKCNPQNPCPDSKSEKTILVTGKVRFEWKITAGDGRFVKLGCGAEDEKNDKGEHVIFQPPYVALPVKNADTSVTTTIILTTIDDGSPIIDAPVLKTITIKTTRKKSIPDKYEITITGGEPDKPVTPALPAVDGTCKLVGPAWKPGDNLAEPVILLPDVADAEKMVLGQWIVLKSQDQKDMDDINFNCSSANCSSSGGGKSYPDNIIWEWSIVSGGGKFVISNNGQYVIYEAPVEMPKGKDMIEVKIKVKVMNPSGERKDPDKSSKEFILKIYQPGIKLSQPDLKWLPEEDNDLEFKSELMYKDGDWKPALAHMCRIQYFELLNVSTEKGVCLNAPEPKDADDCRDLKLKNEDGHEAFDDKKDAGKCDRKEMYQQARTQKPEKEYSFKVYSMDFGSYGFLRSFANVNKGGKDSIRGKKPVYISIPVKSSDVAHPKGRTKKNSYGDNRVTIPYDVDENHIADNGWTTTGSVDVPDPADNNADEDDKPVGDKFKGDGLSAYEEYRGFKVMSDKKIVHMRANPDVKDVFVQNENNLDIGLYVKVSELDVHEVSRAQYISHDKRIVNFNFSKATHIVDQKGLHLVDKGNHSSLLGIAYSSTGQPTIPNWEIEIRVYTTRIRESVDAKNRGVAEKDRLSYDDKLAAVVAHELSHGNNVCHHGEGDPELERTADAVHGLRSGNVDCVMRYDNVGTALLRIPEKPGTTLCTSAAGTGYNARGAHFGDAGSKRGNCKGQIRISAKGGLPKSCGDR